MSTASITPDFIPAPKPTAGGSDPDFIPVDRPAVDTSTPAPESTFGGFSRGSISATPQPTSIAGKVEKGARDFGNDLKYGTANTVAGQILRKLGAPGLYSGQPEAVGDFMGSLPLGVTKATQGVAETAQSGKRWQGTKDAVSGAMQAATIPSAFAAPEAAELAGTGVAKAGDAVAGAVKPVSDFFDVGSVQHPLQEGIRNLLGAAEQKAGVTPTSATSIRDVASNLGTALKAKSSAIYRQLDAATGGRFQRFDEALANIREAIRDNVGLDDDKEEALLRKQETVEQNREEALKEAAAKGVDPNLINQANAIWRQQSALSDLSNTIRQSTKGLRPELAGKAKAAPETVNSSLLSGKLNRLYDKATPNGGNRLADAIGHENAQSLLRHVAEMQQKEQSIAGHVSKAWTAAKLAGVSGGLSAAYHEFTK